MSILAQVNLKALFSFSGDDTDIKVQEEVAGYIMSLVMCMVGWPSKGIAS